MCAYCFMKNQKNRHLTTIALLTACLFSGFAAFDIFTRLSESLRQYALNIPAEKVYVFTDKNIYRPEERIWYSAFLERREPKSNLSSVGKILLYDHFGGVKIEQALEFKTGQSCGFITLPESLKEGTYLLGAFTKGSLTDSASSDFYRQVIVKERPIPGFIIQANLKKEIYYPGKKIILYLRFFNQFNDPLNNIRFRIDLFDGGRLIGTETYHSQKKNQNAISFTLPDHINSDEVEILVFASSHETTEHLYITVPLKNQGIFLHFYPEGGRLIAGITNRLAFRIHDLYGDPIRFSGKVVNEHNLTVANVKSNPHGSGFVDFIPYAGQTYYLQITKPDYITGKKFRLPAIAARGIALSLIETYGKQARFSIKPVGLNSAPVLYLTCKSEDDLFWTKKIVLDGPIQLEVPGRGLSDLAIFDEKGKLISHRLFFIDNRDLRIAMTLDKKTATPRGKTTLTIRTTDRTGRPVAASVAISAADHIRLDHGLTEPDITSYFEVFSNMEKPYPSWSWQINEAGPYDGQDLSVNTSNLEYYNWPDILKLKKHHSDTYPKIIRKDQIFLFDQSESFYSYRNYTGDNYYLASNPGLVNMQKKQNKRMPYYKRLLENGTPLREVVMVMRPYNIINGGIVFYGLQNSLYFQDGALIILDKQKLGTKANLLDEISPFTIESIRISTLPIDIHEFTAFNNVGIIELKTKTGEEKSKEKDKKILDDKDQDNFNFLFPDYRNNKKFNRIRKDYRTTLYWTPNIQTDENGLAVLSFYNSDLRTTVQITAEGITANGHTGTAKIVYEVK